MNIANVFRHPLGYGFLMDITTPNNGGYYVSQNFSQASRWGEIWERELFGSRGDADLGEPVYAVANGQAVYSYVEDGDNNGWGKTIILQHILPDGEIVYSQYSNLESARDLETVDVGEQIGTLGNTGNAATAQLYFSINEIGDEFLVRSEPSNFDGLFDPTDFINEHRFIGAPSRESTHSDLTGDGTDDVIWHNPTQGEVGFWDVGGSYRPYTLLSETTTTHWKVVATGDFTADGTDDILLRNTINGTVGYWDVTDGATRWVNLSNQVSQVWEVAGMGDFTGDGTADVLWYNTQNGAVGIWDITQSQTRWELLTNANSSSWEIAGIGDFTNDGVSDVLWYNSSNATVGYWEMDAGSRSWVNLGDDLETGWDIVGVGDFNGDSKDDILWRAQGEDREVGYQHYADGARNFETVNSSTGEDWGIVAVGDYSGDGAADILWRDTVDGTVGYRSRINSEDSIATELHTGVGLDWDIVGSISDDFML